MAYGALAQRANGILFYALRDAKWNLSEHPAIADAVRRVVTEINTRRPLFQAEHQWWLPEQRYRDPAARFNASLDNSVTTVLVRVPRTGAGVQAGDYIIAVNTTEREHTLSFRLPRSGAENVTVLNEARTLGVNQNRLEDTFPPLGVHVYGPLP